jgi:hypothetical protein
MTDQQPAPYPADTKAKGWRFELDHERIRQSDTWALAAPEIRPWLLMLWITAWEQVPCGSLPADGDLIAARIGMPPKHFAKARAVLMRGWWEATDGRLYHDTIAERVLSMLGAKTKERERKNAYRERMDAERRAREVGQPNSPANVPRDNDGTDAGQPRDGRGCDATGTGTGTGLREREDTHTVFDDRVRANPDDPPDATPTPAGAICRSLRSAGIANVNPGHALLAALLEAGATEAEFLGAAPEAKDKRDPFAYVLGVVKGQREDAAKAAQSLLTGPLPTSPPPSAITVQSKAAEQTAALLRADQEHRAEVARQREKRRLAEQEKAA